MRIFDAEKLADLKAKETSLVEQFETCSTKLNEMYVSDDSSQHGDKYAVEATRHDQLGRELGLIRGQIQHMEDHRPRGFRAAKPADSALARWMKGGSGKLEKDERDAYLGETEESETELLDGIGGEIFVLRGRPEVMERDRHLRFATDSTDRTRSDDDTADGSAEGAAGLATQDIVIPRVVERLQYFGAVKQACDVMMTSHGNKVTIPQMDGTEDKGRYFGSEPQKRDGSDLIGDRQLPPVTDVSFDAHVATSERLRVRLEAFQDLVFDPGVRATMHATRRLARIGNEKYTKGTGNNEPKGIVTTAKEAGTGELSLTVTYDDFIDTEYAIDLGYLLGNEGNPAGFTDDMRGYIGYMCHRNVEKIMRKMRDGDGRPLWVPSIREGAPNTFASWPYFLNQDMDDVAANKHPLLFGNFGHFCVRMVNEVRIFRFMDSQTMTRYSVEYMAFMRDDSNTKGPLDNTVDPATGLLTAKGTVCEAYQKLKIKA